MNILKTVQEWALILSNSLKVLWVVTNFQQVIEHNNLKVKDSNYVLPTLFSQILCNSSTTRFDLIPKTSRITISYIFNRPLMAR